MGQYTLDLDRSVEVWSVVYAYVYVGGELFGQGTFCKMLEDCPNQEQDNVMNYPFIQIEQKLTLYQP